MWPWTFWAAIQACGETSCYATLTFWAHLKFGLIYFCKYTWYVSRSSCDRSPGGYQRTKALLFAASFSPQLSCKSHCRHVGADSSEMETRGKGRTRICYHSTDLDKSSLSCHCLAVTPQCHVLTLSWWRWFSRCPCYETAAGFDPEVGPGGNSGVCSCKPPRQLGNRAGPHPNERLLRSVLVFGRR